MLTVVHADHLVTLHFDCHCGQGPYDEPVWCQLVRFLCINSDPEVAHQAIKELAAHPRVTVSG
jgi:hypothetical protein